MACRHRESEMSLALDGRLPSGRRTELLHHLEDCDACASTWQRMRQAHDLAVSLPTYRPSASFHDGLRQRIASGEGAPEAVYRQPMSAMSVVRPLAAGAAAAAALLWVFTNVLHPDEGHAPASAPQPEITAQTPLQPVPQPPAPQRDRPGSLADATSLASFGTPQVPAEAALAFAGARQCNSRLRALRSQLSQVDVTSLPQQWDRLSGSLRQLRTSVDVMRWLERNGMVTLPPSVHEELQDVDDHATAALLADDWNTRLAALQSLQHVEPDVQLDVHCCRSRHELMGDLSELLHRVPNAGEVFRGLPTLDALTAVGSHSANFQVWLVMPGGSPW